MAAGLLAGLLGALLFGVAAVVQAHAVRRGAVPDRLAGFVGGAIRDPLLLAVVGAYLTGFALHAVTIWLLPLYLAQATVSLSMPVTAMVAHLRLHEPLGRVGWLAVGGVTVGLGLLAIGSGEPGRVAASWWLAGPAWLVCLTVLALAPVLRSGGLLGTLAGCGYAVSAIAVRGLVEPALSAPYVALMLVVPAVGLVAFWAYSRGLERSSVATSTGALIVTQTFLPAVVGVVWLGDGVASWPAVTIGLALATAGSVTLSREG